MSRIDEAWRRASGATAAGVQPLQPLDDGADALLQRYPLETTGAAVAAEAAPRLTQWAVTKPAPAPVSAERRQLGAVHEAFEHKLITSRKASPLAVEQYRRLAGSVHELQVEQGLRTLMVTSAVPGEGKTLTAANLALTLSESCERRVLLIDADLRRPFVHTVFNLSNSRGLSDVLRADPGDTPLHEVSDYLSILPAGEIDEPMALTSDRMRVLLEHYGSRFDWVLVDAAPVGFMPDAQLLARLTRAVLFVIAARSTPHLLVSRAISAIGQECIVGTVLNRVEEDDIPAAGYYQGYYSPRPAAV
jgi:capsular exopolysaccharide synthesis family protein